MSGWDDRETPLYYEAFCRSHSRYRRANAALIAHAQIESGMHVLDVGAGTGRTAEAAMRRLGAGGSIVCVEPSAAMRAEGMRRLKEKRVEWIPALPDGEEGFDRILCGAAVWLLDPLSETLRMLARLLRPGGALCFNIPSLYLMEPDEPGGGTDPLLLSLPAMLAAPNGTSRQHARPLDPLDARSIDDWLRRAGLRVQQWAFRLRLTQDAYAAWLKFPVVNSSMLPGLTPAERASRIDAALESADRTSWKWEGWKGWTAWRP